MVLVPTSDPLFEGFTGADGIHIVGVNFPTLTAKLRAGACHCHLGVIQYTLFRISCHNTAGPTAYAA